MSLVIEDENVSTYKYDHHSALETEMLFAGFIKENYKHYYPIVLVRLSCSFFEQIFYWTLKGKQLRTFLNAKQNENIIMNSKLIHWTPIKFQLHLFPNKSWFNDNGYVGFCWRIHSIPSWIKKVHIEYKMYCIDSLIVAKDRVLLSNDNDNNNVCSIGHGWDVNLMALPQKNYPLQSITFACFLNCKYNEHAKDDANTIKNNQNVLPPDDGYRKLMDKLNYTIESKHTGIKRGPRDWDESNDKPKHKRQRQYKPPCKFGNKCKFGKKCRYYHPTTPNQNKTHNK